MEDKRKSLHLFSEAEFSLQLAHARQTMKQTEQRAAFATFDGGTLATRFHPLADAKGIVVLVHGFTEFEEKYDEMTWYLLKNGLAVFRYDQRGHGHSTRAVDDLELTHVEHFDDYVQDLSDLLQQRIFPRANGLPVFLLGHSMGAATVAQYLCRHPNAPIAKAVLSSPMICPRTHGFPRTMLKAVIQKDVRHLGWEAKFPYAGHRFDPNPKFELSHDGSPARFREHIRLRVSDPYYRNSAATNRWMWEALSVGPTLLNPRLCAKVKTPVLILSGTADTVVRLAPQRRLASYLGNAKWVSIPNAKHTAFTGDRDVAGAFYDAVFRFFTC